MTLMTLPNPGTRVRVQSAEVRGVGVVVAVDSRYGFLRVELDSGVRCSVHAGEYEPIPAQVRHNEPQGCLEIV